MAQNEKNPWTKLTEKEVYSNPWISVYHEEVLNPNGKQGIYGRVHFKNKAIGIIPIFQDGTTILVGQFRYPTKHYSWEIPAGGAPLNDTNLATAQRELLEETGLKAQRWKPIVDFELSNSVSDEVGTVFLATELEQHEWQPEETEQLQLKRLPLSKAFEMVMDNTIVDSVSVVGLLKLMALLHSGRLQMTYQ